MMNELQIFSNDTFGQIRTVDVNGKIYFVASDVARALKYQNTTKAISDHCKGVTKRYILTNGGKQSVNVIPEPDIYRLVTHSKLPAAEKFERWIFEEVLPTIRKTGSYQIQPKQTPLTCVEDLIIQQATLLKELRLKVDSQQQQIDQLKHKPFSQLNTYRSCEAWLRMKAIPYQKAFFWAFSRRCAKYSREHNINIQRIGKDGYIVNAYREDVLERCFGNNVLPAPKQPQKAKNLVYVMAQFFNSWKPGKRIVAIENFQEFFVQVPIKYRDAIWQALTTDISKIPEYIEVKAIRKVS